MGKKRARLLVYAHYNTRLLRRFKKVEYEENWVPCSDSGDNDPSHHLMRSISVVSNPRTE